MSTQSANSTAATTNLLKRSPTEDSWSQSTLANLLDFVIGGDWGKSPDYNEEGFVEALCIRGSEFRHWKGQNGSTAVLRKIKESSLETRRLQAGDILVEISGGGPDQPVGRTVLITDRTLSLAKNKPLVCTNFLRLTRPAKLIDSTYLNNYLQFFYSTGEVKKYQGGSNNLRNLKFKEYEKIEIPVPAFAEQKVIADKLDELLAQVDTLKARLDAIPAILKRFRQSVLATAVSGELTADWQELNKSDEWIETTLAEQSTKITSGSRGWAKFYSDDGAIFIRSQDINTDDLKFNDAAFVSLPSNSEGVRTQVALNDILITITGANVTKCARIKIDLGEAYVSQHVALVRLRDTKSAPFIELCLKAINLGRKQLTDMAYGGGKPGLNLQNIRDVEFKLPTSAEQTEIVRRVEQLFTYADQVEQQVNNAQARVNQLTQAILAKAFRGELTEQWRKDNPELISGDNSAAALLERIRADKETLKIKPKSKRTHIPKTTGNIMKNKITTAVDALRKAGKPLNGQQLLAATGYPSDSSTEELEKFFLDLRDGLIAEKSIIQLERSDDNQDWFALREERKGR